MDNNKHDVIFSIGTLLENNKNFTKKVWVEALINDNEIYNQNISNVTFEPGCINSWHNIVKDKYY